MCSSEILKLYNPSRRLDTMDQGDESATYLIGGQTQSYQLSLSDLFSFQYSKLVGKSDIPLTSKLFEKDAIKAQEFKAVEEMLMKNSYAKKSKDAKDSPDGPSERELTYYYDGSNFDDDYEYGDVLHWWKDCHLSGISCDRYGGHSLCESYYCDNTKTCTGATSITYIQCTSFWAALPLAQGYLVYLTLFGITVALVWFYGVKGVFCVPERRKECMEFAFGGKDLQFQNDFDKAFEASEQVKPLLERVEALEMTNANR